MNTYRDYRKESRSNLGVTLPENEQITTENLRTGAFLRIADAMELMAKNHAQLIADKEIYMRWWKEEKARAEKLQRQVNAYKGIVKKLKKAK